MCECALCDTRHVLCVKRDACGVQRAQCTECVLCAGCALCRVSEVTRTEYWDGGRGEMNTAHYTAHNWNTMCAKRAHGALSTLHAAPPAPGTLHTMPLTH